MIIKLSKTRTSQCQLCDLPLKHRGKRSGQYNEHCKLLYLITQTGHESYLIKALLSILCCFRVVECHRSWGIQPPTMKIFSLADAHRRRIHVE